jgi:transposase
LLCLVTGVVAEADADAWLKEALSRALEANERWERTAAELRAENARLRDEPARRDAELERVNAELAVLKRLVSGRSSERSRPEPPAGGERRPRPPSWRKPAPPGMRRSP